MPELREYTLAEVAECDGKNGSDTWIVIRDAVYDVTGYLADHPGGSELLKEWAGKDGTKDFEDIGHSGDALRLLKTMEVGVLALCDRGKNRKQTEKSTKLVDQESPLKSHSRRRRFIFCG